MINLTFTNAHQLVVVYINFVTLVNQLRLHKLTEVNDDIFVCILLSKNIKVMALMKYTSHLILDDDNITARAIMNHIRDKDVALTSEESHDRMYRKYCQATDGDNSGSKKISLVSFLKKHLLKLPFTVSQKMWKIPLLIGSILR